MASKGTQRDGAAGLVIGLGTALLIHALLLPGFGLYLESRPPKTKPSKAGAQLVRLARESFEQNRRIDIHVREAITDDPERKRAEKKQVDDEVIAPGQVVSLPPPDQEEQPDAAEYASEWNQRTARETRSRDQAQRAPSTTSRRQDGAPLGGVARTTSPPAAEPSSSPREASGPAGPGIAVTGDSGSDPTDGAGERMFALQLPQQAARTPLQLRVDELDGLLHNRSAVPELVGTGDTARVAMGHRPADAARRAGSGGLGEGSGQGLRGGGNGSAGLPSLAQLTPTPMELARLAGAPANDHLPEVEVDAETRLNAWRWKHATYFNRIADAIRREWQPGVLSSSDPTGRVYGFEDRNTVVQVTLDRSGNIVDVNVAEGSGAWALDDEAVRAFKSAGPFANPPVQLFGGEEEFTFLFGFNVGYQRQNFDLDWRPN
jgi:TonB family protein